MNIKDLFEKRSINAYKAIDNNGLPCLYRRNDLCTWAEEAYERGEKYFYCRPVDPDDLYGKFELCEPEYRWFIRDRNGLTEEQFNMIYNTLRDLRIDGESSAFTDV